VEFQSRANSIGLSLNVKKCEIIGFNQVSRSIWQETGFAGSILEPSLEAASLLSAHSQIKD